MLNEWPAPLMKPVQCSCGSARSLSSSVIKLGDNDRPLWHHLIWSPGGLHTSASTRQNTPLHHPPHPRPRDPKIHRGPDSGPACPPPSPEEERGGGGWWRWGWARAAGLDWLQTLKECETCEKLPPCDGRRRRPWIPECVSVLDKVRQIVHWWFRSQYCSTAFI